MQVLLAYLPFAEDDTVEEEVVNALTLLSVRTTKVPAVLEEALKDPLPARRAAAALVLGKVGTRDHLEGLRALLKDSSPKVQFRAAQGLLAAQDKAGVQPLFELLTTAPEAWAWQVDDQLLRLAGAAAPNLPTADNPAAYRKKAAVVWAEWWKANEDKVDLASLNRGEVTLGIYTITEFDGAKQGRVWECGRDGRQRWEIVNLFGAMDCQILANGHVLVSEANVQKVTERDMQGNVTWTSNTQGPAVALQRLPNGNTFICTYNQITEVTPAGQPVYTLQKQQMTIFGAQRLKNGHIAVVTAQGNLHIFDPNGDREVSKINLGVQGGWAGIEVLPNGHYLVALQSVNEIREIDGTGHVHWQCKFNGAFRATKLPNGNVLACSRTHRHVAEFNRNGTEVWGVDCKGQPWSVKYR
jgi:hypothetical protein